MRTGFLLTIILSGCISTTPTTSYETISQSNNDVAIVAKLIQDHLRKTNGREINLNNLIENDSLKRISESFEKIDLKLHRGHITAHYKFSDSRQINGIEQTDKEKEITRWFKWTVADLKENYDGEIWFDYGERFYRVKKIVVNNKVK